MAFLRRSFDINLESDLNLDVENCLVSCVLVDQSICGERYEINSAVVSEEEESSAVVLEATEEVLGVMIAVDFFLPFVGPDADVTAAASSRGRFFDDAAELSFFFFGAKNEVIMMLDWWIGYCARRYVDSGVPYTILLVSSLSLCNMHHDAAMLSSIMSQKTRVKTSHVW